ncbi:MAG: peptidoglycan-binding protein [Rhodospirillales bacterium]|nr:peptidoglycan-binding protein [Rhodospirillales bacterium]
MRIAIAALGFVVLLASGWVALGLMSNRDEREFAVHYSWIVKWALSLARESQGVPEGTVFTSPRVEVAGHSNRWLVSGRMTWRDVYGVTVDAPYTAVIENVCKAYADPNCWRLEVFATGDAAVDLAEASLGAEPGDPATTEAPSDAPQLATDEDPTGSAPQADPVLSLLEGSGPDASEGAVPEAPALPLASGAPLPERKPAAPNRLNDEDTRFALSEPGEEVDDLDIVAALREPESVPMMEPEISGAIADSGAVAADAESQDAAGQSRELASEDEPVGEEDTALATMESGDALPEPDDATALPELESTAPEAEAAAGGLEIFDGSADAEYALAEPATEPTAALPPTRPQPETTPAASPSAGQAWATAPGAFTDLPPGPDPALVVLIQDRLARAGYDPGPIDGRFGSRTQGALMAFQRDSALPITGQPSRAVLAALEERLASQMAAPQPQVTALPIPRAAEPKPQPAPVAPPSPTPNVVPPASVQAPTSSTPARAPGQPLNLVLPGESQSPTIAADESLIFLIQHRLRAAGYAPGSFDGRMSEATVDAIRAYQADRGLPVTGAPTRALLDRLEAEILQNRQTEKPAPTPLGFNSCLPSAGLDCTISPA